MIPIVDQRKSKIPENILLPEALRRSWRIDRDSGRGFPFSPFIIDGGAEPFRSNHYQHDCEWMDGGDLACLFRTAAVWLGRGLVWFRLLFSVYVLSQVEKGAHDRRGI